MPIHPEEKIAGILAPVFALRHNQDLGIGDTEAVRESIEFCADHGIGVLQILPINETGGDHSPYNAISSVALEPVLLSMTPEEVPGLTPEILAEHIDEVLLTTLRSGPVLYEEVKPLKDKLLAAAFVEFEDVHLEHATPLATEFAGFLQSESAWLSSYTLFRTLMNEYEGNPAWTSWKPEHLTVPAAEAWITASENSDELNRFRTYAAYVQWVAFRQWKAVHDFASQHKVRIIGDIPFGISRYSADVWAEPELFDLTWSGGAPPEGFFQTDEFTRKWGQNWGVPLYPWDVHRETNFAWWKQRITKTLETCHGFRIDHVLGFFRIYSFPWTPDRNWEFTDLTQEEALLLTNGREPQFLPRPDEPEELGERNAAEGSAILRVFIEAAKGDAIIAEDLGCVPPYMPRVLTELGIPGFVLPQFEKDEKTWEIRNIADFPVNRLATYATHDHDPLAKYYENLVAKWLGPNGHDGWLEVQRVMRYLGLDDKKPPTEFTHELHEAFIEKLVELPCAWVIYMITDVLGTTQRFNMPGTSTSSNWSERLEASLDDLALDGRYASKFALLKKVIEKHGRLPK